MISFGAHTGVANTAMEELMAHWQAIETLGFDWISVVDHFYTPSHPGYHCHDAVAAHTTLAATTTHVRCGCLVYCAAFRHPAVIASALATIDHVSRGRAELGLGAGWMPAEFTSFGFDFASAGARLDRLEESIQCVRSLLHDAVTDFDGTYFRLSGAHQEPKPVRGRLPIWVGGSGEKRTLRIVARHADGWNSFFPSVDDVVHKREVLRRHCDDIGRDITEIRCSANLAVGFSEQRLAAQFGPAVPYAAPTALTGTTDQLVDTVGRYAEAGLDQINLELHAPWDLAELERLLPALAQHGLQPRRDQREP